MGRKVQKARPLSPIAPRKKKAINNSNLTKKRKKRKSFSRSLSRSPIRDVSSKKSSKKKSSSIQITPKKMSKKLSKKNSEKSTAKSRKKRRSNNNDLSSVRAAVTASPGGVVDKEVFAAGDKIMISVNFKRDKKQTDQENKDKDISNKKPSCVIDIMSSPYQVFEPSPLHETIDVFSDDDEAAKTKSPKTAEVITLDNDKPAPAPTITTIDQEKSPPITAQDSPPNVNNANANGNVVNITTHKGPQTPPMIYETLDFSKGPQTPSDQMDSYDPCNPTESPDDQQLWDGAVKNQSSMTTPVKSSSNGTVPNSASKESSSNVNNVSSSLSSRIQLNSSVSSADNNNISVNSSIPFLNESKNGNDNNGPVSNNDNNGGMDFSIDMDMASPCSPQGSDLSDIFEPPSNNTPVKKSHRKGKHLKHSKNNKSVQMKLIDDKLRIIDDVPTSAVEMAVKEKFLKKVQRQERIVDEIKTVLKPFYNRKRISKESYKEIMRKCVPKVLHSKYGEINTTKITKMVEVYVKKYRFREKNGGKA